MEKSQEVMVNTVESGFLSLEPFLAKLALAFDLDREALNEELAEWKPTQMSLRQFFMNRGLLTEKQFQQSLAEFLQLDFLEILPEMPLEPLSKFTKAVPGRFLNKGLFFPIAWENNLITFAVAEVVASKECDRIAELFLCQTQLVLTLETNILNLIQREYKLGDAGKELNAETDDLKLEGLISTEGEDLLAEDDEEPIRRLVNNILFQAVKADASDIHIDAAVSDSIVRNRIDGNLVEVATIPKTGHNRVVNRVKVMAGLDISTRNLPQDGRTLLKIGGKKVDVRVSVLPTIHGERVVLRLLHQSHNLLKLSELGLQPRMAKLLQDLVQKPNGILLVTGPTGSGKTTTLYACLQTIDHEVRNVISVEDPVEYQISGYGQVQVNEKQGLTFPVGLRSILRQDPDVIMVGEIRDAVTAQIAIQSALTGHLVLSTLHTNDAVSTVIRLIDMDIEPFLISSTLQCVLAQRLVRRLCTHCKITTQVSWEHAHVLGAPITLQKEFKGEIWEAKGCEKCFGLGYRGRIALHELLSISEPLRQEITSHPTSSTLLKVAEESSSIVTMVEDAFSKVFQGLTSVSEVSKVIYEVQRQNG